MMKIVYHCSFPQNNKILHVFVTQEDDKFVVEMRKNLDGESVVFPQDEPTLYVAIEKADNLVKGNAWLDETEIDKLLKSAKNLWRIDEDA